jgi:hypothetical protein
VRQQSGVVRYDVSARGARLTFLAPFDRPASARPRRLRRVRAQAAVACLVGQLGHAFGWRTPASVVGADVAILPYQLEPALAVAQGNRRVLIADEVGLGKTIQGGLIISELVRREPAARVLILVPAAILDQWIGELARRFDVTAREADRLGLETIAQDLPPGDNPWRRAGVWIASLDYVKQPHVRASLPPVAWDLVVVDEAHAACGDSDRHDACQQLTTRSRRVLFLTATPHDGDPVRFARLLRLGELDGVQDQLTIFRRSRHDLLVIGARRVRWRRLQPSSAEVALFDALTAFERVVLRAAADRRRDAALLLLSVFRKRALSTMVALAVSLRRRLAWLEATRAAAGDEPTQPSLAFDDEDGVSKDVAAGLASDVGVDPRHERSWVRRLIDLADRAACHDTRAAYVASFVQRAREPVIVFTEFRDSLDALRQRLGPIVPAACLHGRQTEAERRSELRRFLDGAARLLLATDVASLGLNLQDRARIVINLELPWNPLRIEQRAGRVDRIGQRHDVHITLLVIRHEAEAPVLVRMAQRVLTARGALGADPFGVVVPSDSHLRASVLAGAASVEADAPADWRPERRWTRPATFLARGLERRRRLARHWRGPVGGSRPKSTGTAQLPPFRRLGGGAVLTFLVPVVDGGGATVASHVVAVRCRGLTKEEQIEAADSAAVALGAQTRRLARLLSAHVDLIVLRERAIGALLVDQSCSSGAQPGLFDRWASRAFEQAQEEAQEITRTMNQRVEDARTAAAVDVGRPSLVVAFITPP